MDWCTENHLIKVRVINTHWPFIPYFRRWIVSPNIDYNFLVFKDQERLAYWEINWEPTMHSWGMSLWMSTIEYILVKFCCEESTKSMNFTLFSSHFKLYFIEHFHTLLVILLQFSIFLCIRVRAMSKCENWFRLISAWVSCTENLNNIW
jgi:hypothetical protein